MLGFGEEVGLILVRDADVVREDYAQGEAGQILVCGASSAVNTTPSDCCVFSWPLAK